MVEYNDHLLKTTKEYIISELGMLDDIPYELANTVANIYLRGMLLCLEDTKSSSNKYLTSQEDKVWLEEVMTQIPKVVEHIRKVKPGDSYNFCLTMILAMWKYRIKNPWKKTFLRVKIESMNKNKVREIPDLARRMGIVSQ